MVTKPTPATKLCIHCKTAIAYRATKCPHCTGATPVPGVSKNILWCVAIAVALIVIGSLTHKSSGGDSGNIYTASDTCHNAVSDRLRSPGSASWQNASNESITGDPGSGYTVSGHVDSENGFGASLRSYFTCSVTVSGDTYSASVTDVTDGTA